MRRKKRRNWPGFLAWIGICAIIAWRTSPANHGTISQLDLLATAESLLSLEPLEVRELRSREVEQSEAGRQEYYFGQLSEREQRAYREMLQSFRDWEPEFYLTVSEDEEIDRVYHAVLNDHPELFWARNRNTVYKTRYNGQDYSRFTPAYSYTDESGTPGEQAAWIQESLEMGLSEIDSLVTEGMGDYEKAETVYTYLIDRIDYVESSDDQSVAGVFWRREAVCAGYAAAAQLLLEHLGVHSIYVEGSVEDSPEGHAWNMIELDGEWYYLDATNGDQPEFLMGDAASLEEHKTILMDYLCPFPWEYEATYHPSEMFVMPSCTAIDCNFYVRNQGCFDYYDPELLRDYFRMRIDNGAAVIRFKFSTQEAFEAASADWMGNPALEDAIQYYMSRNGLGQVQYHYGSLDSLRTMYFVF